jgi:hypothetical protein
LITSAKRRCPLTTVSPLTYDEHKAAEAAFRGLPLNPGWSQKARQIYLGIVAATSGRDIVTDKDTDADRETALLAVGV